jgi:hypothetical protein
MVNIIQQVEQSFILLGVFLFKTLFFFLEDIHQSLIVSFVHYAVFIVGFYYFIYANPKSKYRRWFFAFVVFSMVCYFVFNRCILTQIEISLCPEQNKIQETVANVFGEQSVGNRSSKVVLTTMAIITGIILLHDS